MTQEEKAKAYDEVVNKLKGFMAQGIDPLITRSDVQDFFPELKESEDERIRKHLIKHFGNKSKEDWNGVPVKRILAWLEKQGEQKPTDKVEPQKELAETYLTVFDKKFPILPTLRGKQLADYKNFLNKCQQIFGLKYWGIRPLQAKLFEKLSLLWAAWGAEHLKGLGQTDGDTDNEKQEWSEEDEKRIEAIIAFITTENNERGFIGQYGFTAGDLLHWLKSLRPQSHWKPSDGQINALKFVIEDIEKDSLIYPILNSFLEQLKKLREE